MTVGDSLRGPLGHPGCKEDLSAPAPQPGLRWAIKRSFLSYLARVPDGRMSATDGATLTDEGEVVWDVAPDLAAAVPPGADQVLTFSGDLRFSGHGGLLFVRVADPHIVLSGDTGELSIVETFSQVEGSRLLLVTFRVAHRSYVAGCEVLSADEVRLTDDGTEVFNMVYPAAEPFEPFTVLWPSYPSRSDRLQE